MSDPVRHPDHYKANGIEVIDVIEAFGLGFHLGNTVKYVLRSGRKGDALVDLKKGREYLDREIARRSPEPLPSLVELPLTYLATPYTKYKGGLDKAFRDAAKLAAALLTSGIRVYSPIAHTHPLAVYGKLDPRDHSIWLPFDEAMMTAASALLVAHMPGWESSYGIAHEVEVFTRAKKPIFDLDPETMVVTRRG